MARQLNKFEKVMKWIFDIPYEYRKTKRSWQQQSAFVKIASILAVMALLALSCAIFYLTGMAFAGLSGRDLAEIVRSLILFIGIFCLVIIDAVFISIMYRQLIFNATVAFVCRPKKQPQVKISATAEEDAKITANAEEEKVAEQQPFAEETVNEMEKTLTPEAIQNRPTSKTSRAFDTTIGWINIALIIIYTAGLFFSFAAGFSK